MDLNVNSRNKVSQRHGQLAFAPSSRCCFGQLIFELGQMRSLYLVLAALAVSACASPEGPGSLDQIATAPQPAAVQTAPAPTGVTSQPLGLPGQPNTLATPTGQQTTLDQFGRPVATTDDPFATSQPLGGPQTEAQQSLSDAVNAGLQPQQVAPSLVPTQPQLPRVALAPITTAPEPHASRLFDAIDDESFRRGMQLAFFGDETAQFVVRSQVSAIPADQTTSVLYVFDVFDANGTLRHRVSGSQLLPRSGPDGWSLIDLDTTQRIAQDVASRLVSWFTLNPS